MSYQFPRAKGENTSLFLKSKNVNAVQDIVEAINNLEVVVQQADSAGNIIARVEGKVNLTPRGLTILIPTSLQPSGSGTGGNQITGGAGPPSATTLPAANYVSGVNPSCYVDETNDNFYFCSTPGTQATSVWTQISGGGSSSRIVQITAITGTYITAVDVLNNSFTVYKPFELQNITSETIDGTVITYSNYTNSFNDRTAQDTSGNIVTQFITPRYVIGQYIRATSTLNSFTGNGYPTGTFLLEDSPSRQWGEIN